MEVDRIMYIFGSFTRKKQDRRKSLEPSSISAGNSPLHQKCSRPASQSLCVGLRSSYSEGRKSRVKDWECGLCKRELVEPRLLGCLHSFCTRCLQGLRREEEEDVWNEVDDGSIQLEPEECGSGSGAGSAGSAGSGYESDARNSNSEGSLDDKPQKYGIFIKKVSGRSVQLLVCPTCGHETQLPPAGVSDLPLNYVLLRKMSLADREDDVTVLCDMCDADNKAESRCSQCLVSVCAACGKAHGRTKATSGHYLEPLMPQPTYCARHTNSELTIYCATCQQVICGDCSVVSHAGHALASAARAAAERARALRDACERAKLVPEHVERAARALSAHALDTDSEASRVEAEVRAWAEQYRRAAEAHGRALAAAAARARARQRQRVERAHQDLQQRAQHAQHAVRFTEELLSGGRAEEVLSLSGPALRRLQRLTELPAEAPPRLVLRLDPAARLGPDSVLCGRLLTQAPDPDTSILHTEGLQDLHVDCEHEAIVELRDSNGERIWCGGEQVVGYLRRRDSSERPTCARAADRHDGSYALRLAPRAPGAYLLAVTLNDTPIKGSPFACCARVFKSHAGQFHCCTFCSSGGRRDVRCGCGATMPGGYKGCGHGHAGWPGARHWSCCGSTLAHGPCAKHPHKHRLYQFSL
ncbi:PREDICTED: tripartite motif-containing protein 45-like [Papilio xuthus]|uniref:Tripartite motif-containing protein 45-like n=1 Tax=Papilio xuthus TaxID=66420 RepID=A0AAJ6ZXK5_PAPXU|nr:PREDICTED: tripartite motif-containing protein 45-like [Papilio xuthus]